MTEETRKRRRPSMSDVARLAGVSQTTVSFILNNTPGSSITQETRARVWQAVQELGYRPNVSARNLRTQSTNLIGYGFHVPLTNEPQPILDRFLYSTIRSLEAAGYHLLTFMIDQHDGAAVYRELYRRGQVAGFVLANTNDNDPRIEQLIDEDIPFAAFGRANDAWSFPWVDVDGVNGLEQVIQHLTANGHTRIGLITWPPGSRAGSHREAGYRIGLAAAGIDPDPAWVVRGENTVQTGAEGMRALLALPEDRRPAAIACVSDTIAIGAMSSAAVEGYVVGRDLAVTGYDDSSLATYLHPPLTSIRQPIGDVGREIVRLLLHQLERKDRGGGTLLKPRLVVRDSSDFRRLPGE